MKFEYEEKGKEKVTFEMNAKEINALSNVIKSGISIVKPLKELINELNELKELI
jgi:hypothetical protein